MGFWAAFKVGVGLTLGVGLVSLILIPILVGYYEAWRERQAKDGGGLRGVPRRPRPS